MGSAKPSATFVALFLAATTLLVSLTAWWQWYRQRDEMLGLFDEIEFANEFAVARHSLRRANEPFSQRARAIQGILSTQLTPPAIDGLTPDKRRQLVDKTELATQRLIELSRRAVDLEPTSWVPPTGLGCGQFLSDLRSKAGLERSDRNASLRPLLAARQLAPSSREVDGCLALVYLQSWRDLSPTEREAGVMSLRKAMESEPLQRALLPAWIGLQHDYDEAVAILPSDPRPWRQFYASLLTRGRLREAASAYRSLRGERLSDGRRRVGQGVDMVSAGELYKGTDRMGTGLAELPVDNEALPQLTEVLRTLPPGPIHSFVGQYLPQWIQWAGRQCVLSACPVPDDILHRLATAQDRDPVGAATLSAYLTGNPQPAADAGQEWSLHWLALLRAGRGAGAEPFPRLPTDWQQAATLLSHEPRDRSRVQSWSGGDWLHVSDVYALPVTANEETTLQGTLTAAGRGGLAELWLDGDWVGVLEVRDRERFTLTISPGRHLVEFRSLHGTVLPAAVSREPADRSTIGGGES